MYMTAFLTFCHSHRAEVVAGQGRAGQDNVLVLSCRLIFYCVCFTSRSKSPLNCKFFMFEFSASITIAAPAWAFIICTHLANMHGCVCVCESLLPSCVLAFCIWHLKYFLLPNSSLIFVHWESESKSSFHTMLQGTWHLRHATPRLCPKVIRLYGHALSSTSLSPWRMCDKNLLNRKQ